MGNNYDSIHIAQEAKSQARHGVNITIDVGPQWPRFLAAIEQICNSFSGDIRKKAGSENPVLTVNRAKRV